MTEPATPAERRFRWPADYYSAPTPDPVLPSWIAYGCGAGSVLVLLMVFAGGIYLTRGGFAEFMDMVVGMSMGEMRGMYTPAVTGEQKESLEAEVERMRERMRNREVPVSAVQPFLEQMRLAMKDQKIDPGEVESLEDAARQVQQKPSPERP